MSNNIHLTIVADIQSLAVPEFLRSGNVSYTERSVDSIEVEMHGNIAVTTGRMHIKTNLVDPRRQEFTIWYVRVYERRDDLWQLLSHRSVQQETGPLTD